MEDQTSTETNVEVSSQPTPSFGDLLGRSRGKAEAAPIEETAPEAVEAQVAEAAPAESTAPIAEAKPTEATPAPAVEAAAEVKPTEPVAEAAPQNPRMVPVSALQQERERRQIAEALLAQREQEAPPAPEPAVEELDPVARQLKKMEERFLNASQRYAQRAHADFDEAYKVFAEECQTNQALAQVVVESEDPGEAAYQAGKNLMLAKKYGVKSIGDINGLVTAIEKDVRADERKKADAEWQTKITGRAAERSKTPTDITEARAAGGATESEPVYIPSFGQALGSVFKRR